MTHSEKVALWLGPFRSATASRDFGVEIGAFKSPVPGIRPFYVDRFREYANERCMGDFWGDACSLPFLGNSLDYVVTSHVLEHTANPVAALFEWARVVRHGGIIYMVVPDRRLTFDHPRGLTPPEHMMEDFHRGTGNSDGTHIADYLDRIDWTRYHPAGTPAEHAATREHLRVTYTAAAENQLEINMHFHVFEPSNLGALIGLMNRDPGRTARFEILDTVENFPDERPDGFLMVVRVRKGLGAWWTGRKLRRLAAKDERAVLSPEAKPLFD